MLSAYGWGNKRSYRLTRHNDMSTWICTIVLDPYLTNVISRDSKLFWIKTLPKRQNISKSITAIASYTEDVGEKN